MKVFTGKDSFHCEQFNFKKLAFHLEGELGRPLRKMRVEKITKIINLSIYYVQGSCQELCNCRAAEGEVQVNSCRCRVVGSHGGEE